MFEGFRPLQLQASDPDCKINLCCGGDGKPRGREDHSNYSFRRMKVLPCGHHPAEQAPEQTCAELDWFFRS